MTITKWYSNNVNVLHGLRVGILFGAELPIELSQVLQSDKENCLYMMVDRDQLGVDETVINSFDNLGICNEHLSIENI
jgi:hypothetical protein